MHNAPVSAAKRCSLFALTFCLVLSASLAHGISVQQGDFVMVISPVGDTFPLFESATSTDGIIGTYSSGLVAFVMSTQNAMVQVRIGGRWDGNDGVIGYVPESYLSYADAGIPVPASLPVAEVRPADGSGAIMLRTEQGAPGPGEGLLPEGVQLELLGEMPDCYHVQFGEAVGFLPKDTLQPIDKQAMFGYSVERDGFAIVRSPEDADVGVWDIPVYAYPDTEHEIIGSAYLDETVSLLNDLGEWAQVRTSYGVVGFMQSKALDKYLIADMVVPLDKTYGAGNYMVGNDLPPGLYTLDVPAGRSGGIEAIGEGNDAYHNYHANDLATFAMYLVEPMSVEISGEAILSPMNTNALIAEDIGWQYSGSGRFFCGIQLRSHWVFSFDITLAPGESVGYFVRTPLSAETGESARGERFYLTPGEVTHTSMTQGEFIELRNCVIVGKRGNG